MWNIIIYTFSLHGIPVEDLFGDKYIVFLGFIDITTNYGVNRNIEHFVKTTFWDGSNTTIQSPVNYAARLQHFLYEKLRDCMVINSA